MSAEITSMFIRGKAGLAVNKPVEPVPPGWAWVLLSDIARQETGHTPSRSHPEWWGGDVPWIGIRDAGLHHGGVIYETLQTTNNLGLANSSARLLPKGTVCLSRTASVGYVTIMGRDMATSQDFATWTCSEALLPEFLLKALMAEGENLRKFGKGTTHTTIYFPEIRALHICLPPLAEQKRIVAKLDALNAKSARARTELARIEALVSRYKQAVLSKAFSGELTEEWRSTANHAKIDAALELVRKARKQSAKLARRKPVGVLPKASLPQTWCWISPDELASNDPYSIGIGPFGSNLVKSDYRDSGTRLIFVRDIRRENFEIESAVFIDEVKAKELYQHSVAGGDLLITKMGDPPGDTAIFPVHRQVAVITADCIKLRPHSSLTFSKFLYWAIRSSIVAQQILDETKGVAQQKLSLDRFRQIAIPTPPLAEQHEIVHRIESAFARIDRLAAQAKRALELLGKLDEAILAKAFRGELVPQDENDEPAEKLLERIRAERATAPKVKRGRGRKV
jgi:type I restriction enzyme S subunit